jgi:hypothetical protein
MGFVALGKGGYVVTARDRTLRHQMDIDEKTLKKVAELLGISKAESEKIISEAESIYIYRGKKRSSEQE